MAKHIHKYQFKIIGKDYRVFACALPDCTHYLAEELVVGKESICWKCGNVCTVRKENDGKIRHKPHHKTCNASRQNRKLVIAERPKEIAADAVDKLLDELLGDSKTGT